MIQKTLKPLAGLLILAAIAFGVMAVIAFVWDVNQYQILWKMAVTFLLIGLFGAFLVAVDRC